MVLEVLSSDLRQNTLKLLCRISLENERYTEEHFSSKYKIGKTIFQFKINSTPNPHSNAVYSFHVNFDKKQVDDKRTYTIALTSKSFGITNERIADDATWRLIISTIANMRLRNTKTSVEFDIHVHMTIGPVANPLANLYEDTELTDFELCGDHGSVKVHKSILAMSSPVMRSMLTGEWRETAEGKIHVTGTSKETLQQFKDYMYLYTVPETGLDQLMLLASYYIIPDLEQICADKLIETMTPENAWHVFEFVAKFKTNELLSAILQRMGMNRVPKE